MPMKIAGAHTATSTFGAWLAGSIRAFTNEVTDSLVPFNFQLPITSGFLMIFNLISKIKRI